MRHLVYDKRVENSWIVDKVIKIQVDNIELYGEMYMGTPGLWMLIAERNPKEYSSEDYERYKELLYETNLLHRVSDPRSTIEVTNQKNGLNSLSDLGRFSTGRDRIRW